MHARAVVIPNLFVAKQVVIKKGLYPFGILQVLR